MTIPQIVVGALLELGIGSRERGAKVLGCGLELAGLVGGVTGVVVERRLGGFFFDQSFILTESGLELAGIIVPTGTCR